MNRAGKKVVSRSTTKRDNVDENSFHIFTLQLRDTRTPPGLLYNARTRGTSERAHGFHNIYPTRGCERRKRPKFAPNSLLAPNQRVLHSRVRVCVAQRIINTKHAVRKKNQKKKTYSRAQIYTKYTATIRNYWSQKMSKGH